jgi:hypothetical protein
MKTSNKIKLANLTTWTMVITISFIALFFIGFIVSNTFDLNVFTNRTSNFILSFIGFSAVIVLCSAILNISLNISLIADDKIQNSKENGKSLISKKFLSYTIGLIVIIVSFLFLGDYLTRKNEKEQLFFEANDIIARYESSIDEISLSLSDTSKIADVPKILLFLSHQKLEFPNISIISSDRYDEQLTFLEINEYDNKEDLIKPYYNNSFYKCQAQDCDYLTQFFTGLTNEKHFWTEKNQYELYFPFDRNGKKFILLFSKYKRGGKIGSY